MPGGVPSNVIFKRRETAWEFMRRTPSDNYLKCIQGLSPGRVAETATGSASTEVVDVGAELSTLNNIEIQAMKIISESPWHLWQARILTLRNARGEKMLSCYNEPVAVAQEFWKMSTSQQDSLRAEVVTRQCPLAGHSVLLMHRAWEIGRLAAHVKKYYIQQEKTDYQQHLNDTPRVGWMRDIPPPYEP